MKERNYMSSWKDSEKHLTKLNIPLWFKKKTLSKLEIEVNFYTWYFILNQNFQS